MAHTTTITVQQIHCESCERSISAALSRVNGVLRVAPKAESSQVTVSYDEALLDEAAIRSALADIGYEPVG